MLLKAPWGGARFDLISTRLFQDTTLNNWSLWQFGYFQAFHLVEINTFHTLHF